MQLPSIKIWTAGVTADGLRVTARLAESPARPLGRERGRMRLGTSSACASGRVGACIPRPDNSVGRHPTERKLLVDPPGHGSVQRVVRGIVPTPPHASASNSDPCPARERHGRGEVEHVLGGLRAALFSSAFRCAGGRLCGGGEGE